MRSVIGLPLYFKTDPNLQGELINAISSFASDEEVMALGFDPRGIDIYQRNLLASANRALAISYPTVKLLLGDELFMHLSKDFLLLNPKTQSDWSEWGSEFSQWLKKHEIIQSSEYLADSAKLDWMIHQSSRAKDSHFELGSLSLLETSGLNEITIEYKSSVSVFYSDYPIVEIFLAHQIDSEKPDLSHANEMLSAKQGQVALISREGWQTKVRVVDKNEEAWLSLIYFETTIVDVLSNGQSETLPFEIWLPKSIEEQLIHRIERI